VVIPCLQWDNFLASEVGINEVHGPPAMDDCVITTCQEDRVVSGEDELRAHLIMPLPRSQQIPTPRLQVHCQRAAEIVHRVKTSQRRTLPDSEPPATHTPDGLMVNVRTLSGRMNFDDGVSRPHENTLTTPFSALQARKWENEGVGARPLGAEGAVRKVWRRFDVCRSWISAGDSGSEDAVRTAS
jgi:hypothetical protein